jgi:hypothetical protein
MPQAYSPEPSLLAIERPRCPECQTRMMLTRVERGPAGSDLPTFECLKCEREAKSAGQLKLTGLLERQARFAGSGRVARNHQLHCRTLGFRDGAQ